MSLPIHFLRMVCGFSRKVISKNEKNDSYVAKRDTIVTQTVGKKVSK